MLLVLALLALIVGILCLWFENAEYEWKYKGGPTVSAATAVGSIALPFEADWRPARLALGEPADVV